MPIIYEKRGHIAYATIAGENHLNPMTPDMYVQLYQAFLDYQDDRELRCLIITGKGEKAFSVGGHIKRDQTLKDSVFTQHGILTRFWHPKTEPISPSISHATLHTVRCYKPVLAAVNGYCLGAALKYLCMHTDIRVAAEHARFGFTDVQNGLGGDVGTMSRLMFQIPYAIAMRMVLTGDMIDAAEAYRIGLVNEVVPMKELMAKTEEIAERISQNPPILMRAEKESMLRSLHMAFDDAVRFSHMITNMNRMTHDASEGVAAFAEKRAPQYKGE